MPPTPTTPWPRCSPWPGRRTCAGCGSAEIACASRASIDRLLVGPGDHLLERPFDEWLTARDDVVRGRTEGRADEPPERCDLLERRHQREDQRDDGRRHEGLEGIRIEALSVV